MKRLAVSLFCMAAVSAAFAEAYVTNVLVRQRRPWSQKVDIDFTVGGERADVEFTATWEGQSEPVPLLPAAGLTGRACGILGDDGHVSWDPIAAGYELPLRGFRVTATAHPVSERTWLVVDLATGAYEYMASEPAGGFNADDVYKTSKMVFRRIPATTFTMGYSSAQITAMKRAGATDYYGKMWNLHTVTLSDDYYMAIYRLTVAQYEWITAGKQTSSGDDAKKVRVGSGTSDNTAYSYNAYRGSVEEGVNWPTTEYAVKSDKLLGKFRTLTGNLFRIDFPTDAQWENACRCGTATLWSHGGETDITKEGISNMVDRVCASSTPGLKDPNAYGIYDMIGSAFELCNDQWVSALGTKAVTDPVGGLESEGNRVAKGGGWAAVPTSKPGLANPAYRMGTAVAKGRNKDYAFIVARPCIHLNSVFSR